MQGSGKFKRFLEEESSYRTRPAQLNYTMCARYRLSINSLNRLLAEFAADLPQVIDYRPRYNIAPTQQVLAIRYPRQIVALKWGLLPAWAKDAKAAQFMARA